MSSGLLDPIQHAQLEQLNRRVKDAATAAHEQDDLLADQDVSKTCGDGVHGFLHCDLLLVASCGQIMKALICQIFYTTEVPREREVPAGAGDLVCRLTKENCAP
jgi:hypothetical protein